MLCEDTEQDSTDQAPSKSSQFDSALYEFGMYYHQYIQEMRRKSFGSKPNPVKISDLDFSPQNNVRFPNPYSGKNFKRRYFNRNIHSNIQKYMPYVVPERIRTKSVNSDSVDYELTIPCVTSMEHSADSVSISVNDSLITKKKKCALQKSKSLEDIRVENIHASRSSHEMEFVSSCIQKLKVTE